MNDEERMIRALNELAGIEKQKRQNAEDVRKREEKASERRKRLKDYFYNKAAPISMHILKYPSFLDIDEDK